MAIFANCQSLPNILRADDCRNHLVADTLVRYYCGRACSTRRPPT